MATYTIAGNVIVVDDSGNDGVFIPGQWNIVYVKSYSDFQMEIRAQEAPDVEGSGGPLLYEGIDTAGSTASNKDKVNIRTNGMYVTAGAGMAWLYLKVED